MNKVGEFKINNNGRDIAVGDIHGCFAQLKRALSAIDFNRCKDRLFICGDLVDRGPNSYVAKEWIEQNWCFSVFGNHDAQFAFKDSLNLFSRNLACMPVDPWYVDITEDEFNSFSDKLREKLFPAIEIDTKNGKVVITHAGIPFGLGWNEVKNRLNNDDYDLLHDCMWERDTSSRAQCKSGSDDIDFILDGISHSFHGHSPNRNHDSKHKPYSMANRFYIDTCAYKAKNPEKYPNSGITLYDITDPKNPIFPL